MISGCRSIDHSRVDGVTVIVCCFNSCLRIADTLKHLCAQQLPSHLRMEVLIVNNASDDNLENAVRMAWNPSREDYRLKIVEQPIRGLANARMKGVVESAFDYAIFCDDDNWLCPTYVQSVYSLLKSNPMIGIVGGASTPTANSKLPSWFYTNAYAYAVGVQSACSGDITDRHYVWGAGMGFYLPFLRKAFEAGVRPVLSDRIGTELLAGNDTELCFWFVLAGYYLWYDETLEFQHFIPDTRIQKDYMQKVKDGFRLIDPVLRSYKSYLVLQEANHPRSKAKIKKRWNWEGRYLKAICVWYLTNKATRTKIRRIQKAIVSLSRDELDSTAPLNP